MGRPRYFGIVPPDWLMIKNTFISIVLTTKEMIRYQIIRVFGEAISEKRGLGQEIEDGLIC